MAGTFWYISRVIHIFFGSRTKLSIWRESWDKLGDCKSLNLQYHINFWESRVYVYGILKDRKLYLQKHHHNYGLSLMLTICLIKNHISDIIWTSSLLSTNYHAKYIFILLVIYGSETRHRWWSAKKNITQSEDFWAQKISSDKYFFE